MEIPTIRRRSTNPASAQLIYTGNRQTIEASASWLDELFLQTRQHNQTLVAEASYSYQIRPDLSVTASANTARTYQNPVFGASESYGLAAQLTYNVNSTVELKAGYAYTHQQQISIGGQTIYENAAFISLTKKF